MEATTEAKNKLTTKKLFYKITFVSLGPSSSIIGSTSSDSSTEISDC